MTVRKTVANCRLAILLGLVVLTGCSINQEKEPVAAAPEENRTAVQLSVNDQHRKDTFQQAIAYLKENNKQAARELFSELTTDGIFKAEALLNLAILSFNEKHIEDARRYVEMSQQANDQSAVAYNLAGLLAKELGAFKEAETAYQQSIDLNPNYDKAVLNLAILYDLYMGKLADALVYYRKYQSMQKQPDGLVTKWIVDLERRI